MLAGLIAAVAVAACGGTTLGSTSAGQRKLILFAASSLKPPFDQMAKHMNLDITFNYAGTQTLTSQLTQGAQADVFASADTAHMKTVQDGNLLNGASRIFAHNRLEIVVAKGNPKGIHSLSDLAKPGLVVVLADPSVPAGKYAQQALAEAAVTVKPVSLELQVTAVLSKVALGEADAGIVYHSDLVTSRQVDGVTIPDNDNVIAAYPLAILKDAPDKTSAQTFVDFVTSSQGQAILTAAGFEGM